MKIANECTESRTFVIKMAGEAKRISKIFGIRRKVSAIRVLSLANRKQGNPIEMTGWHDPLTHHSLLIRLHDAEDRAAWDEFYAVYQPLIFRLARARGFQDADANEVVQEVLLKVSRSIGTYTPNHDGPSFRGWLAKITRNQTLNRLRQRAPQTIGGTSFHRRLENRAVEGNEDQAQREFEYEHRRQAFLWAAEQLRNRFSELNWRAFWLTCVEGKPVPDVARELGISTGQIYVARCRVIARIKEMVQRLTEEI